MKWGKNPFHTNIEFYFGNFGIYEKKDFFFFVDVNG